MKKMAGDITQQSRRKPGGIMKIHIQASERPAFDNHGNLLADTLCGKTYLQKNVKYFHEKNERVCKICLKTKKATSRKGE